MCHKMINLVLAALNDVENAETVLKIKAIIALFIQTMDVSRLTWNNIRGDIHCALSY